MMHILFSIYKHTL